MEMTAAAAARSIEEIRDLFSADLPASSAGMEARLAGVAAALAVLHAQSGLMRCLLWRLEEVSRARSLHAAEAPSMPGRRALASAVSRLRSAHAALKDTLRDARPDATIEQARAMVGGLLVVEALLPDACRALEDVAASAGDLG